MKKVLSLIVLSAAILGLSSCSDKVKDATEPVISGVSNKSGVVNEQIDLLEGITASDDVDKDITSKIEVSVLPSLTVTSGKVKPTQTGDYEVKYLVKDTAGNEGTSFATLSVLPALAEKTEYKKYTFVEGELNGFTTFLNAKDGVIGTAGIVKGSYRIDVTSSTGTDWHIKFEKDIDTVANADYKITYNLTSNVAGKVMVNGESQDIVVGANKIVKTITASAATLHIEMQFGLLTGPFVVDISSVIVNESVGADTFTNVTPATFAFNAEGTVVSAFDGESLGTVDNSKTQSVINITKAGNENGVWQTKLFVKTGMDLEAKKYKISIDLLAVKAHGVFEICYNNGDNEKGVGALYGLSLEAGVKKTIEFVTTLESSKDNLTIQFQLGKLNDPNTGNTITINNLKIEEVGGDKTVTETKYVFTPQGFDTYNDAPNAQGYLYTENNKLVYEMTKIGQTDWHNKMFVEKLRLEADKIYTISFKAKADKNISCAFFLNIFGKWDPRLSSQVNFTTTEQTFEFTTTAAFAADMDFEILFQFGSAENSILGSAKIEFSEFIIYSQDVSN